MNKYLSTDKGFDELIAYYNKLRRTGDAAWIPDYVFTSNKWQFQKIQFPIKKNSNTSNNLVFKQVGIKELQMALYIPINVIVKDEDVFIQRDYSLSDQLTIPLYRKSYNDNIFNKNRLIIGDKLIECFKSPTQKHIIPIKMYCIGVNSCLANSVINNLGGMNYLVNKTGATFLRTDTPSNSSF